MSGNPGGVSRARTELKAVLAADSLWLYEKAKKLLDTSIAAGDLQTASRLVLGLLKKTIPDTNTLELAGAGGGPVAVDVVVAPIDRGRLMRIAQVLHSSGALTPVVSTALPAEPEEP